MWELIQSNKRKSTALVLLLAAVLMGLGYAIGGSLDPQTGGSFGVLAAVGVWVVMMAVGMAGGEKILLASSGAREVKHDDAPQLYNIVEEMKIASGLPAMPKVYIIDSEVPNAFAVGLKPERAAVAVTTGLLSRLNRDELQGVVAHELGHISNRDTMFMTLAGVTVGAVIILADVYLRSMMFSGRGRRSSSKSGGQAAAIMAIVALVLSILAPFLAQMLYFACSRRREYLADACAAQFTRYPEGLASALEKIAGSQSKALPVNRAVAPMYIVNPLAAAGSSSSLFSTHPSTQDRIRVLRGMTKGSSLAAYEEAYRALHKTGVVASSSLNEGGKAGIRPAAEAADHPVTAAQRQRDALNVLHKVNQYLIIPCACGIRFKVPPDFKKASFACPRCGAEHPVPAAGMAAAAAVLNEIPPPFPKGP